MGLLPLVSIVARPVKHARLVTALLKATALMRSKAQVHISPSEHAFCEGDMLRLARRPTPVYWSQCGTCLGPLKGQ